MTEISLDTYIAEIKALRDMTVTDVQRRYEEITGRPTRSRNGPALRHAAARRLAKRALEIATSPTERRRIQRAVSEAKAPRPAPKLVQPDPRIPPVGTVLRRHHGDEEVVVKVLRDGFRYRDRVYRSLSAIAREATGQRWNGVLWFGLRPRQRGPRPGRRAS